MIIPGKYVTLKAEKATAHGVYLLDKDGSKVLLPKKYIPKGLRLKDDIKVFIYLDSQDRIVATTQTPKVILEDFAWLKVVDVTKIGAFMDWGLDKDIFVPFREQAERMEKGKKYLIYLMLDIKTNRLIATSKTKRFLEAQNIDLSVGEQVDVLIGKKNDIGIDVVINNQYSGLIFREDWYSNYSTGDKCIGYVKNIRADKKIDVILQKQGYDHLESSQKKIMLKLKDAPKGFLALSDKSSPQEIKAMFEMSKKTFKKACGMLYKKRFIRISDKGIYLVK
jgi:predicted RNA-binding protein (virulence factor B family)